jgi:hypothetical protein
LSFKLQIARRTGGASDIRCCDFSLSVGRGVADIRAAAVVTPRGVNRYALRRAPQILHVASAGGKPLPRVTSAMT